MPFSRKPNKIPRLADLPDCRLLRQTKTERKRILTIQARTVALSELAKINALESIDLIDQAITNLINSACGNPILAREIAQAINDEEKKNGNAIEKYDAIKLSRLYRGPRLKAKEATRRFLANELRLNEKNGLKLF